jgi:hypothetical protein
MTFLNIHNIKAFAIHLAISASIAGLSAALVYGLWYPAPLSNALGVSDIFLMLLAIDLILGPLMTLVVYKPHKSSLKFDLTVIAVVQLAALLYGLHTVGIARPAYMVYTKDRFDLVLAHEVVTITGNKDTPQLQAKNAWLQPLLGYELSASNIPNKADDAPFLNLITLSAVNGGPDVANVSDLHAPYAQAFSKIKATALPFTSLKTADLIIKERVNTLQAKYPANSIVAPLKIKYTIYTVIMNPVDVRILGIEPVDIF